MKPLLTILLIALSFGVKGQWGYDRMNDAKMLDSLFRKGDLPYFDPYLMYMAQPNYPHIIHIGEPSYYSTTTITIGMIFDYVQECYEDSTHSSTHYIVEENPDGGGAYYDVPVGLFIHKEAQYIRIEKVYTHTTPTFEGFAEYLKRKYIKE